MLENLAGAYASGEPKEQGEGFTGFTLSKGITGIDHLGVIDRFFRFAFGGFRAGLGLPILRARRMPTPDPSRLREGRRSARLVSGSAEGEGGGVSGGDVRHAPEAMSGGGL